MMEQELDTKQAEPVEAARVTESFGGPAESVGAVSRRLRAWIGSTQLPPGSRQSVSSAGGHTEETMRFVQRYAGNSAAVALVDRLRSPSGIQRDGDGDAAPADDEVAVTGVQVSADRVTIPLSTTLTATATPADATGVVFSVEQASVDPANVTIGESDGAIAIAAGQQGGDIDVKATSDDGSYATAPLRLIETPTGVASTTASGGSNYGGQFVHTFSAPSGQSSGLDGANINERFASHSASPPWGGSFDLAANAAGSHGWDLDSSGMMTGPDSVTIEAGSVDIGRLVQSASNPSATAPLPQGFTMTQNLHATSLPGGALDAAPFATVSHNRRLVVGPEFEVSAGDGSITENYTGPAAVTNAAASSATVMASPPRPASGTWTQRKVTVTADPIPSDAALTYSLRGARRGCTVDDQGEVSIGSNAGSITVRVNASDTNYDEVTITITRYVAPSSDESESESAERAEPAETAVPAAG